MNRQLTIIIIALLLACAGQSTRIAKFSRADLNSHRCDGCQQEKQCQFFNRLYLFDKAGQSWQGWPGGYYFCNRCMAFMFMVCSHCKAAIDKDDFFQYNYLDTSLEISYFCPSCAVKLNLIKKD